MVEQPVSVRELSEYWEYIDNIKPGYAIERHIGNSQMPRWEDICSGLNWRLCMVDDGYFSRKHHGYCGVYRLIGLATDNAVRQPASISRVCGEDVDGTLYIGESGWLNERLNQLRRSLRGEDTHGAGAMWRQSAILQSKFPFSKLGVAMLGTSTSMRGWIERDLIRAYLNTFGDTPPLNCSF